MSRPHPLAVRSLVAIVVLVAIASLVPPISASQAAPASGGCAETTDGPDRRAFYVQPGEPGYRSDPVEPATLPADVPAGLSGNSYGQYGGAPGEQFVNYAGVEVTHHVGAPAGRTNAGAGFTGEPSARTAGTLDTDVVLDCGLLVEHSDRPSDADADWSAGVEVGRSSSPFSLSPVALDSTSTDGSDQLNHRETIVRAGAGDEEPTVHETPGLTDYAPTGDDARSFVGGSDELGGDAVQTSELRSSDSFRAGQLSTQAGHHSTQAGHHSTQPYVAGASAESATERAGRSRHEAPVLERSVAVEDESGGDALELATDVPVDDPVGPAAAGGVWLLTLLGMALLVARRMGENGFDLSHLPSPAIPEPASLGDASGSARRSSTATGTTGTSSDTADSSSGNLAVGEGPVLDDEAPNDYVVERLLESAGGRLKQGHIVEATGWSKSKVSRVLSTMDEAGTVVKVQLGRENVICLDGHEPDLVG